MVEDVGFRAREERQQLLEAVVAAREREVARHRRVVVRGAAVREDARAPPRASGACRARAPWAGATRGRARPSSAACPGRRSGSTRSRSGRTRSARAPAGGAGRRRGGRRARRGRPSPSRGPRARSPPREAPRRFARAERRPPPQRERVRFRNSSAGGSRRRSARAGTTRRSTEPSARRVSVPNSSRLTFKRRRDLLVGRQRRRGKERHALLAEDARRVAREGRRVALVGEDDGPFQPERRAHGLEEVRQEARRRPRQRHASRRRAEDPRLDPPGKTLHRGRGGKRLEKRIPPPRHAGGLWPRPA